MSESPGGLSADAAKPSDSQQEITTITDRRWWMRSGCLNWAVLGGILLVLACLILPAIQQARTAARRSVWSNNLKQLGLAFHNYHDVYSMFPPGAVVDQSGSGLRGWTCSILPYLDGSPLYSRIDQDEPWDGVINHWRFRTQIPVYLHPGEPDCWTTEGFPLIHCMANPAVLYRNSSIGLADFPDGTAHGWLLGGVRSGYQPWGYPFNWRMLSNPPANAGFLAPRFDRRPVMTLLKADGAVEHFSSESIDPTVYASLVKNPPLPARNLFERPDREFQSSEDSDVVTGIGHSLDDLDWEGLSLVARGMPGRPVTFIEFLPNGKMSLRDVNIDDVRTAVGLYPDARVFLMEHPLDDDAAALIAGMPQLVRLRVSEITLTEAGVQQMARMSRLRFIHSYGSDDQILGVLRAALPECHIP